MKLSELAALTDASVQESFGNIEITGAAGLDEARQGHVTFLANPRYTSRVNSTSASAIYVSESAVIDRDIPLLRARDPYLAYTRALILFHPEQEVEPFIHPSAFVDATAHIAKGVCLGAGVVIGRDVEIEEGVRIYPNVTVYERVRIGKDSIIHSGVAIRERSQIGQRVVIYNNAVVGCDGFGYAKDEVGHWLKIPQTGNVVIEDDVEIGAGATIDRASVGETRIKRGAKIDNLVQIGHSCTVGEDALLCAQVGLAGSSHIGNRVILTGQVGIGGHLTVGDDAMLDPQSGVPTDVLAGQVLCGSPAIDHHDFWRSIAVFKKLGEIPRRLRNLENRVKELEPENPHTKS